MSTMQPAAAPSPEDLPPEEQQHHEQPDPFGDLTGEDGERQHEGDSDESHKSDPRAE